MPDGKKVDVGEPNKPVRALNSLGHLESIPVSHQLMNFIKYLRD
jgi:hypothetical protein